MGKQEIFRCDRCGRIEGSSEESFAIIRPPFQGNSTAAFWTHMETTTVHYCAPCYRLIIEPHIVRLPPSGREETKVTPKKK